MKTSHECSLKNQNAQRKANQRDHSCRGDRETDVACAENRPEKNRERDNWQDDEDRHRPCRNATPWITSHQQTKHRAAKRADEQLARHRRSHAELFEMIVSADAAHQPEEWSRFNENRKAIANDRERRRHAEPCEQQHHDRHRDSSDKSSQQASKDCSARAQFVR